jgi:hypothetical protein
MPPPPPAYAAPVVPAKQGSSTLKIVAIVLCCLGLLGFAVVAGGIYLAHRVKQAVVQEAKDNGVDLHSIGSSDSDSRASRHQLPKACDLLTKEEVSGLIGQPIERAEAKEGKCEYYGPAGLSAKLAKEETTAQMERAKTPGGDPRASALEVQKMLNQMGAQAGNSEAGSTGSGGELPLLVVSLSADGKTAMNAMNLGKAIFGAANKAVAKQQGENPSAGDSKAAADIFVGSSVTGLGDQAMWIPKSGLLVLKGDTLLEVNPGLFPDYNPKAIAVARAVLPKL